MPPRDWPREDDDFPESFRVSVDARLRTLEMHKQVVEARIKEGDRITAAFRIGEMKPSEMGTLPEVLEAAAEKMQETKHRINRLEILVSISILAGFVEQLIVHLHLFGFS